MCPLPLSMCGAKHCEERVIQATDLVWSDPTRRRDLGPFTRKNRHILMVTMAEHQRDRFEAGRPPWDTWNGVRVGLLAGGSIGVVLVAISGSNLYWLALIPAVLGGVVGYWSESRKRKRRNSTK